MKVLVEFDQDGNIRSIVIPSSKNTGNTFFTLNPHPAHKVTELEIPHIKDENDFEHIREIKKNHRIEIHQGEHRVVHK